VADQVGGQIQLVGEQQDEQDDEGGDSHAPLMSPRFNFGRFRFYLADFGLFKRACLMSWGWHLVSERAQLLLLLEAIARVLETSATKA
jgi:hypothetical protein